MSRSKGKDNSNLIQFTCTSFTWYGALQRKYVRAFLAVNMTSKTEVCNYLQSPLAQAYAVLRTDTHVFPVNPLYVRRAVRLGVHWGGMRASSCSQSAEERKEREASTSIPCLKWQAASSAGATGECIWTKDLQRLVAQCNWPIRAVRARCLYWQPVPSWSANHSAWERVLA